MSLSDFLEPVDKVEPLMVVLYGEAGAGKTNFAATFPKPLFIRVENGTKAIVTKGFGQLSRVDSVDMFWHQLEAVLEGGHDFKTLVIDSITELDRMFIQSVLKRQGVEGLSLAYGSQYRAGADAVANMHARVRKTVEMIQRDLGMNVVFIAHTAFEKVDLPDKVSFNKYTINVSDKNGKPYLEMVDVACHIRERFIVNEAKKGSSGKATATGARELIVEKNPASETKNRFGITGNLVCPLGENPLLPLVRSFYADKKLQHVENTEEVESIDEGKE